MTAYCCGFLFSPNGESVALIEKQKPAWQAGLWNGIGGKIEGGELPHEAMVREFAEETGVRIALDEWLQFARLEDERGSVIHFFKSFRPWGRINAVRTQEGERVDIWSSDEIPDAAVIPNLKWLIPLATDRYAMGILDLGWCTSAFVEDSRAGGVVPQPPGRAAG